MANNQIITTGLDFETIKANLKAYFRGQTQFSDYDFEGSALSFLIDVLAYNTHYNALYTNLALNESFLDSASKRSSVVSKAKELGYFPKSARASTAVVDIVIDIPDSVEESLILPFNTPVNAIVDGVVYTFNTTESNLAYNNDGIFTFANVEIKEGIYLNNSYIYSPTQPIELRNPKIDTSTMVVRVFETPQSSNFETFVAAEKITKLDPNSPVYFLKEIEGGYYAMEFGDGVLGKTLAAGSMITMTYLSCNGSTPNRAKVFTYAGSTFGSPYVPLVLTRQASVNGSEPEDTENIRWNAPRGYVSQDRCVTTEDFKSVIYAHFPTAQAIAVWGGEDHDPPSYSDVFISIKPSTGEALTDAEKNFILTEVLAPRKAVTIHPKFMDPEFLYIDVDVTYYYNPNNTILSANDISQLVYATVIDYNQDNLDKFEGILRYTQLTTLIDKVDKSITSNITKLTLEKEVFPKYNQTTQYNVAIHNPIYNSGVPEDSVISTGFYIINVPQLVYIRDIPTEGSHIGSLELFYYNQGTKTRIRLIGTIDYIDGTMSIDPITITGVDGDSFRFRIKPESNNIVSSRNMIASIVPDNVKVTAIIDSGIYGSRSYQFTSSRS